MRLWWGVTAGLALSLMLWTGSALAQGKPNCDAQGRMKTREKVEGQVLKVDNAKAKSPCGEPTGPGMSFNPQQRRSKTSKSATSSRPS